MMRKAPATAGRRLTTPLRTVTQPRRTSPGDCLETIAQLLPSQGPGCKANPESWSTVRAAFILQTQGVLPSPSAQGCSEGVTPVGRVPGTREKQRGGSCEQGKTPTETNYRKRTFPVRTTAFQQSADS